MNASTDGRTYVEVSGDFIALSHEEKASEEGQAPAGLRQKLFMGNTLRGLLLHVARASVSRSGADGDEWPSPSSG